MSIVENVGAGTPPPWLRWAVYALSIVGLALGIAVAVTGNPVASALALAAPLAALGLTASAPALFETKRRRGRGFNPLVGVGVLGAIFAAIGPDLFDAHLQLIGGAVGLAAGLGLAFATPGRPSLGAPIQYAALMAVFGALYGMAAVTVVDVRFDRAPAQIYRTSVTDKYETHGKTTGYHLQLAPWGPRGQATSVGVSDVAYNAAQPGDPICMSLHPGVLGAPWYVVTPCPAATAAKGAP
jgi:hypothetical protein